jgi:cobalt-precorrin 5A hydrolase
VNYISNLWVGIGCKKGSPRELIEIAIAKIFRENGLSESAIAGIATIDSKISEVGLIEFCQAHNLPLKFFPAEVLRNISVPNPSEFVTEQVGTTSVAEAAAIRASLDFSHSLQNHREEGIRNLLIPKQVFCSLIQNQKCAVTVAVAISEVCITQKRIHR